jgi:VanZ family protein
MSRARRILSLWLPVVVWAAVIFALSSIPSLSSGLGTWDLVLRKLAHAAEFALLAALLLRALARPWLAFLFALAYAASDELHQHFVRGRVGAPRDVAIDAGGALIGLALLVYGRRRFARTAAPKPAAQSE